MAKDKRPKRRLLDPDDVLAGRVRNLAPRDLIELIRHTNPSGLDLAARESARRYALKSRLQSLLVRLFADDLAVEPDARDPAVALLRHRPLGADACHARVRDLDEDARSWVEMQIDLEVHALSPASAEPSALHFAREESAADSRDADELSVSELLRAGREAVDAFDYELARSHLLLALDRAPADVEVARAALTLLVDHLAADRDALALEARLSPPALKHPDVRLLLALAAARSRERDRALRLARDHRGPRAAEPLLALARAALDEGALDRAAGDLADAKAREPSHPEILGLADALAARRAAERKPLEDALAGLVAEGRLADAAAQAHAILTRWPNSDVARRALRADDDRRRAEEGKRLLTAAEEAAREGRIAEALTLIRRALASSPRGDDATRARARAAELEAMERARLELAEIEETARLLRERDRGPGIAAYVALDARPRARIKERIPLPCLEWADAISPEPEGAGARTRAVVAAVLALQRASEIAEAAPDTALELLGAHAKLVQGTAPASDIAARARRRVASRRRDAAGERLEAARAAFGSGALERAEELYAALPLGDLPEAERQRAEDLRALLTGELEGRRLAAAFEQLRRDGELFAARESASKLVARAQDAAARARWEAARAEASSALQRAFRLRVDTTAAVLVALRDFDLRGATGVQRAMLPGGLEIALIQTRGVWVFLRVIDLGARVVRARVVLRTPAALDFLCSVVDGDRLVVIGQSGCVLEIGLTEWDIAGWYDGGGDPRTVMAAQASTSPPAVAVDLSLPGELVEDAALVPEPRSLWQVVHVAPGRWIVRIVDLARRRIVRELKESSGRAAVRFIDGRREPTIAVVRSGGETLGLYDPRGGPLEGGTFRLAAIPDGVVVDPAGDRILVFTDPGVDEEHSVPVRWCSIALGSAATETRGVGGDAHHTGLGAASDPATGMVFVFCALPGDAYALLGLRRTGDELVQVFRAPVPARTAVIRRGDGSGFVALASHDDGVEVAELGPEPPRFRAAPSPGRFQVKYVNGGFGGECHRSTGARLIAVQALAAAMKREGATAQTRRIEVTKQAGDPERALDLGEALELVHHPRSAGHLAAWSYERFPGHPRVRLREARVVANLGRWGEVRDLLAHADPSSFDDGSAQHLHHLLGAALLRTGEPDEALPVLERGAEYRGGQCDLSALVALCAPLTEAGSFEPDDGAGSRAWSPDQAFLRTLVRAIEAADACLGRGDFEGALRALDLLETAEAHEVQTEARRAEAHLAGGPATDARPFEKGLALASFCAAHAERKPYLRRELPLPRGAWDAARLDELAARATAWLDATLGDGSELLPRRRARLERADSRG